MTTPNTARDEVLALFKAAWDADAESTGIPVLWENVVGTPPEATDVNGNPTSWARAQMRHVDGGHANIGNTRFDQSGLITIQIFTPSGFGLEKSDKLADVARKAFEGKKTASGVWFRDARINEEGPDGPWFMTNVFVTFEYDQLR